MVNIWVCQFVANSQNAEEVLFTEGSVTPDPGGASTVATFDLYKQIWRQLEGWGISGLMLAEHHFSSWQYNPAPHVLLGWIAASTSTLRLSTLGAVLPLYDARSFIEQISVLDYLSDGRFEIGIAPGAGDAEGKIAGLKPEDIRPRYYSAADVLHQALNSATVTHKDAYNDLDNVIISPPLRRAPRLPVWTTAMSERSSKWAANRGYGMFTAFFSNDDARKVADAYRVAADEAGFRPNPDLLGLRRRVFVAPTDSEAQDIVHSTEDLFTVPQNAGETADQTIGGGLFFNPDDFVIGSPETVAERLIEDARYGGFGQIAALTDFRTWSPADFIRSHELLGAKVGPILRSATL